jgi:ribosomal protein L7/L12
MRRFVRFNSDKITPIVDSIASLNLKETAELIAQLKKTLQINQVVHQPIVMAQEKAPEKKVEKTSFNITLEKFDAASKAKVIKEIKQLLPGANLVEAKKFVESAPKLLRENCAKDEADKIKKLLESVGATVLLE